MDHRNDLQGHIERNGRLLATFREKRVDLQQRRSIELHFWAWGQPNSARLAQELYRKGFMVLMLKPAQSADGDDLWNVEAGIMESILYAATEDFTVMLIELADRFDAVYDGWGTSL